MTKLGNFAAMLAAASLVAGSAAHAADAPAALDVPAGEMGCMVVLGLALMATDNVVEQQKTEENKQHAREMGTQFGQGADWYMARVSTWPEANRDSKAFDDAFAKVRGLDSPAMSKMIKSCDDWYRENRHATLEHFKSK